MASGKTEYATAEELGTVLGKFGFGVRTSGQQETLEKWDVNNVPAVYLRSAGEMVGKALPKTMSDEFHLNVVETCRKVTISNHAEVSSVKFKKKAVAAGPEMTDADLEATIAAFQAQLDSR